MKEIGVRKIKAMARLPSKQSEPPGTSWPNGRKEVLYA